MRRFLSLCLLAGSGFASILAAPQPPQHLPMAGSRANASKATIEGLVRDLACPIQNLDGDATHLSVKCVMDCVQGGSPLVILSKDGGLYLPISDTMPDADERQKLMPFVGKYVQVRGTVFERKGTRAIIIAEIKEMKGVHLTLQGE